MPKITWTNALARLQMCGELMHVSFWKFQLYL